MNQDYVYRIKDASPSYFFIGDPCVYAECEYVPNSYPNYAKSYGAKGSILTMELNLNSKELIFYIDNICYGPAVKNIKTGDNIQYKLAITLYREDLTIKIIKFEVE